MDELVNESDESKYLKSIFNPILWGANQYYEQNV